MLQKATAEAKSNIAFIKWTIRQQAPAHVDSSAGDYYEESGFQR
ncbi:hypothetical protein ANRL1_00092 [Anaerolineae bacterium]|nr:hypothetical protein ANRL1_00092 [Anaerolineae bacterium]